jgi:hypothetical protein
MVRQKVYKKISVMTWLWNEFVEKFFGNKMVGGKGDRKAFSAHGVCWYGLSSAVVQWKWLSRQLGKQDVKRGYTYSVSVFMTEVMRVLLFQWLPWWCGGSRSRWWLWLLFFEVNVMFILCAVFATADHWFSSLVSLMWFKILVVM